MQKNKKHMRLFFITFTGQTEVIIHNSLTKAAGNEKKSNSFRKSCLFNYHKSARYLLIIKMYKMIQFFCISILHIVDESLTLTRVRVCAGARLINSLPSVLLVAHLQVPVCFLAVLRATKVPCLKGRGSIIAVPSYPCVGLLVASGWGGGLRG